MIFVDSNIPMYLVSKVHPHQTDARLMLERAVLDQERLVTDAEVLQEILHRYVSVRRPEDIDPAFDALLSVVDEVFPVTREDVEGARDLLAAHPGVSARDAVHVAVMQHHGVSTVLTFDRGFDRFDGLTRLRARQ